MGWSFLPLKSAVVPLINLKSIFFNILLVSIYFIHMSCLLTMVGEISIYFCREFNVLWMTLEDSLV